MELGVKGVSLLHLLHVAHAPFDGPFLLLVVLVDLEVVSHVLRKVGSGGSSGSCTVSERSRVTSQPLVPPRRRSQPSPAAVHLLSHGQASVDVLASVGGARAQQRLQRCCCHRRVVDVPRWVAAQRVLIAALLLVLLPNTTGRGAATRSASSRTAHLAL